MSYPTFRRMPAQTPRLTVEAPKRRDKELGTKWAKAASAFLRRHPFCAECRRHGRDVIAALVDHIVPRSHGGDMWDRQNWQPLCSLCHNGVKRDLERLAVEMGDVRLLINWMRQPETRPGRWAFVCSVECDDAGAPEDGRGAEG